MLNLDRYINTDSAVLICTDVNRRYLSGVKSSAGYLFLTQVGNFLLVDGRYFEAAQREVHSDIKVVLLERLSKQLGDMISRFGINTIFTETEITVNLLNTLKDILHCEVIADENLSKYILENRSVKSEEEIEKIISAQRIAEKAYANILNYIRPEVSEREIALRLDFEMQRLGSQGVSFETIVVSGANSSLPHGVPGDKLINTGDFVTLDFGAVFDGYHSDMTRTVAVGSVTDEMTEIYNLVLTAQTKAIETIKAGVKCSDVDAAARDIITHKGFAGNFNHSTGHGVGLQIHEYPNLSARSDAILLENQVVTCEPGIYIPGKFGVRIEDMVVVRRNTIQNLTKEEKTLIIL